MEKAIIVSSIPLHIAPGVGCAGVMLMHEPIVPDDIPHESESKASHDIKGGDENANESEP
jgi:hypothetical protein